MLFDVAEARAVVAALEAGAEEAEAAAVLS
jgi:hypothetical protein